MKDVLQAMGFPSYFQPAENRKKVAGV